MNILIVLKMFSIILCAQIAFITQNIGDQRGELKKKLHNITMASLSQSALYT